MTTDERFKLAEGLMPCSTRGVLMEVPGSDEIIGVAATWEYDYATVYVYTDGKWVEGGQTVFQLKQAFFERMLQDFALQRILAEKLKDTDLTAQLPQRKVYVSKGPLCECTMKDKKPAENPVDKAVVENAIDVLSDQLARVIWKRIEKNS